jgi:hypothetical protein
MNEGVKSHNMPCGSRQVLLRVAASSNNRLQRMALRAAAEPERLARTDRKV